MASSENLLKMNLKPWELVMDRRPGGRDSRYYCLPPFRGDPSHPPRVHANSRYPFHLVTQGHVVGTFDTWGATKAAVVGFEGSSHKGYRTRGECVDAWQSMCRLGVHPHQVDPAYIRAPDSAHGAPGLPHTVKTEEEPRPQPHPQPGAVKVEVPEPRDLALHPTKSFAESIHSAPYPTESFAGSNATKRLSTRGSILELRGSERQRDIQQPRAEQQYRERQLRGEQPDILLTRSFQWAAHFALDATGAESDEEEDYWSICGYTPTVYHWHCFVDAWDWSWEVSARERKLLNDYPSSPALHNMPRAGTAARRRARLGEDPVKPGRKPWIHGTKLKFFEAFKDPYIKAAEISQVEAGRLYDDVTNEYLKKYGYNLAYDKDLRSDQDIASDVDEDENVNDIPPEEAASRADYRAVVRVKVGAWLRSQYGSLTNTKRRKKAKLSGFRQLFDNPELDPPKPVLPRILHYYSHKYYKDRIKARFDERWASVSKVPPQPGKKPVAAITVHNTVIKEAWLAETEPFKAEVLAAMKAEHDIAVNAYSTAVSGEAPSTPGEYQIALDNIVYYLQPFLNAIQERVDRGGVIEMFSVHAGMSKGLAPRIWADFDRAGFEAVRKSFRDFSDQCFSMEERHARAVNGMAELPPREEGDPSCVTRPMEATQIPTESEGGDGGAGADDENPLKETGGTGDEGDQNEGDEEEGDDEEGDEGDEGDDEDNWQDEDGERTPQLRTLHPALLAEIDAMSKEEGRKFSSRLFALGTYEFEREGVMARNHALMRQAFADGPGGWEGVFSDIHPGKQKKKGKAKEKRARKEVLPAGSPRHTRGRARLEAQTDGQEVPVRSRPATLALSAPQTRRRRCAHPLPRALSATFSQTRPDDEDAPMPSLPPTPARSPPPSPRPDEEDAPIPSQPPTPARTSPSSPRPDDEVARSRPPTPACTPPTSPRPNDEDVPMPSRPPTPARTSPRPDEGDAPRPPQPPTGLAPPQPKPKPNGRRRSEGEDVPQQMSCWWESQDTLKWTDDLRNAFAGFSRLKGWGRSEWEECVKKLVAFEGAWSFPEKGLLSAPTEAGGRPAEFTAFMRNARKWGVSMELQSKEDAEANVGPRTAKGSFAHRWALWWTGMQPEGRLGDDVGMMKQPEGLAAKDWEQLAKMHGRNGLVFVVAGLLWWGEALAAVEGEEGLRDDWMTVVEDVRWALEQVSRDVSKVVKRIAGEKKAVGKGLKRKAEEETGDKENGSASRSRQHMSGATELTREEESGSASGAR
ncbi:hypothetical protein DFH07DRAFT_765086 [Mycena maculata]|uniref:Ribonuclease H1 N-terminal domain-containing protein n=1 Tax=Mycena maculata TaxID=230809 RepID=A0AAD7KAF1_9AGAR|nr:hypothetical protein DFH07DRAFT_765086 [Mycena maculata]